MWPFARRTFPCRKSNSLRRLLLGRETSQFYRWMQSSIPPARQWTTTVQCAKESSLAPGLALKKKSTTKLKVHFFYETLPHHLLKADRYPLLHFARLNGPWLHLLQRHIRSFRCKFNSLHALLKRRSRYENAEESDARAVNNIGVNIWTAAINKQRRID